MTEHPVNRYAANAERAAALASNASGDAHGCDACLKSGLPMLLVRPGLADTRYAQGKQPVIGPWLDGQSAPVALSYSRYVMRTLRQGYVMVYYETPHTPLIKVQNGWQAFRVYAGGYLTPHALSGLAMSPDKAAQDFACTRTSSYAIAMLFVIPYAKHTGKVWVTYSDHPFSEGVRDRYARDAVLRNQRMSQVNALQGSSARSQAISESLISQAIADYDQHLPYGALRGNPHPSLELTDQPGIAQKRPERAGDLMQQAQALCEAGGYSIRDVKVVCVPDAVGITHEAATLRSTLCNSATQWLEQQPEGQWRLQTAMSIEGLLREVDARTQARKAQLRQYEECQGKPITRFDFESAKQAGTLPPDAQFEPNLIVHRYDPSTFYPDRDNGTVRLPSARWVDAQSASVKEDLLAKLEGGKGDYAFREFLGNFNRLANEDEQRRRSLEPDYGAWLRSAPRRCVTDNDCDTANRMDGMHYAHLVSLLTVGGPMTEHSVQWYADFLTEDPEDKNNLLMRALLGNQADFFESFKAGKLLKEAKTLLKLFEESAPEVSHTSVLTADQRVAHSVWGARLIKEQMPTLKLVLSGYGHGLILLVGATAAILDKHSKLGADMRKALTELMQAIVASTAPQGVTAQPLKMSLTDAQRWWRAQANAISQRVQTVDRQVRSLAVGGALALDLIGAPKSSSNLIEVYLLTRETLPKTLTQLVGQGVKATEVMTRLVNESAKVLRDGAAPLSAAAGVLNALSLNKASQLYETGTQEERRKASFMLLGAGLGLTSVVLELSEAVAKQQSVSVARGLKIAAGFFGVAGIAVEAVFSVLTANSEFQKNDEKAFEAFAVQTVAFVGAGVTNSLSIALTAKWITTVGAGLSWTGWTLILVAVGMTAGYIAALLQDTQMEEWIARSIWGRADDQWDSIKREQEALNKILLGLSVEFDYSQSLLDNLKASTIAADNPFVLENQEKIYFKQARLRVFIPEYLRKIMQWNISIYLHRNDGNRVLVYRAINPEHSMIVQKNFDGVLEPEVNQSENLTVVTVQAQMLMYPGASAFFDLYDDHTGGQLLIDERFSER